MNVLEIRQLYKNFGSHEVIKCLNLSVPENSVYGFVGKNGAGKTTTMKMVVGLLKPAAGEIFVCGERVSYGETKTNRNIGYLPDVPEFYGYLRPMEYLKLCGQITGMSGKETREKSEEMLSLVGLADAKRKIGGFSHGMKQRLGIAQALLNEPKLLICDEPTSALDPIGRKEILDILFKVKGKTTVIFSTHILSDVERICDHVAVLHRGKAALVGTLSEIKKRHRHDIYVIDFKCAEDADSFSGSDELKSSANEYKKEGLTLSVKVSDINGDGQFLIDLLSKQKITPSKFEIIEPTLESLFVEAVQ